MVAEKDKAEAVILVGALDEKITEARQASKDLDAAIARSKDELQDLAKGAAKRYLAKAMETAAAALRNALRAN